MINYARRRHFFRDEEDNRTVVVTAMLSSGGFVAYVYEADNGDVFAYGYGHSRLAAIADLNDNIKAEG